MAAPGAIYLASCVHWQLPAVALLVLIRGSHPAPHMPEHEALDARSYRGPVCRQLFACQAVYRSLAELLRYSCTIVLCIHTIVTLETIKRHTSENLRI